MKTFSVRHSARSRLWVFVTVLFAVCFGSPSVSNAAESVFEPLSASPSTGNRPGFTYRSFSELFGHCRSSCEKACLNDPQCKAWSCYHPSGLYMPEAVGPGPIVCHLKEEMPPLSPRSPSSCHETSGNGVVSDCCYTSSYRLRRSENIETFAGVASAARAWLDPGVAGSIASEIAQEQQLIGMVYDLWEKEKAGIIKPTYRVVLTRECIQPGSPIPAVDGNTNATDKRGRNGERFTYDCPPGLAPSSAYGTDIYTDDSSICTAAVHIGLIRADAGGRVTIEIRPPRASYRGSARNGITTYNFGNFAGSYVFVDSGGRTSFPGTTRPATLVDWSYMPLDLRGRNGQRVSLYCPGGGHLNAVYGSRVYTDDSYLCSAAAHWGVITADVGGNVTIEIGPGLSSYVGGASNGVESRPWGPSAGSFTILGGER